MKRLEGEIAKTMQVWAEVLVAEKSLVSTWKYATRMP